MDSSFFVSVERPNGFLEKQNLNKIVSAMTYTWNKLITNRILVTTTEEPMSDLLRGNANIDKLREWKLMPVISENSSIEATGQRKERRTTESQNRGLFLPFENVGFGANVIPKRKRRHIKMME